jgi:hypothetical protein
MNRRAVCFFVFLMLVSLVSLGSEAQVTSTSTRITKSTKRANTGARAHARLAKTPSNPPPIKIGFLAATQIAANPVFPGAGTYSPYPAVLGDFAGDGDRDDVAAIVNNGSLGTPAYAISAVLGNGDGTFQGAVLTALTTTEFDPIFVGDVNGDKKDDIVILHQAAPATVQVWLSNGDGTFTETSQATIAVTSNTALWATVTPFKPDTSLDIVVADSAAPNGNIWVLKGDGTGNFTLQPAIPFTGQLNQTLLDSGTVAFADLNNDGYLDFAGPAGVASSASLNQMVVYLNNGSGGFTGPTALATSDLVYDSCFNAAGNLSGHATANDIVSANCLDNNTVTVYVNNGTGTFSTGVYAQGGIDTTAVSIADMNGDGKNDIVSSNQQGADVTVLLGNGDGTMQPAAVGYATGGTRLTATGVVLTPAVVADFNKDGHNDVIVPDGLYSFVYLPGFGDGAFRSAVDYYSEPTTNGNGYQTSVGLASGDFNGDGNVDFVVGNSYAFGKTEGNITVFVSNGDGTLKTGVNYPSPTATNFQFQFVAVGDFNGDGKLDIAATDAINGGVQIFTGNGDGTFTAGSAYPTGTGTYSTLGIIVGDFNGDGKTDLAVVDLTNSGASGDVGVLINNGARGFNPVVNYPTAAPANEITAADVNGDKNLDLIVPLYGTSSTPGTGVQVLLGKGDGTFPTSQSTTVGNNPYAAAIGDLNGDGKADLAVTIQDQTSGHNQGIAVALGNGDGTFQTPTLLSGTLQSAQFALTGPGYVKIVDLNQDGHLDLLYTNSNFSTVGLMYGKGDGTFYDPVEYPAGSFAFDLAFADVNGDGIPDVVTTGSKNGFSGVTVLLNAGGTDVTEKSSANPVAVGTAVTFSATVVSSVRGVTALPTGTVKFYDGATLLGSGTLNSSGDALFSTSTLTAATHSITAQYSGDGNFVLNTSAALSQVITAQPSYTLAANPTTHTVNPGSSAQYAITLTPVNGYDGTVTFTCPSSLPTGVTCSFNPTSLSGSVLKTTLTLTTQGPTAALIPPAGGNSPQGATNLWASLSGIGLFGLVLAGDCKKRNRRRMAIMLGILALVMVVALGGCGGGSSSGGGGGGGGGGGTPANTYTIKTTATGTAGTNGGNTTPQTLTVTLVVQ